MKKSTSNINKKYIVYVRIRSNKKEMQEIVRAKEKFPYKWSRLGYVSKLPEAEINTRYQNGMTVLHNEIKNNLESDYAEVVVALVKMGANIGLLNDDGKTALDLASSERCALIYENLKKTSHGKEGSIIGVRVDRACAEIEIRKNKEKELSKEEMDKGIRKYFDNLFLYVINEKKAKVAIEEVTQILEQFTILEQNSYIRESLRQYVPEELKKYKEKEVEAEDYEYLQKIFIEENNISFCKLKEQVFEKISKSDNEELENLEEIEKYICEYTRDYKAYIDITDEEGKSLILRAIEAEGTKNINIIKMIFDAGANIKGYSHTNGDTLMSYSIKENDEILIDKLIEGKIEEKVDINIQDREGKTGLHYAAIKKYNKLAKELLELGADVDCKDNQGKTALIYAVENENVELIVDLCQYIGHKKLNFFMQSE